MDSMISSLDKILLAPVIFESKSWVSEKHGVQSGLVFKLVPHEKALGCWTCLIRVGGGKGWIPEGLFDRRDAEAVLKAAAAVYPMLKNTQPPNREESRS